MRKLYFVTLLLLIVCMGCQWQMRPADEEAVASTFIVRYDQVERRYLTTGDFSSLQQLQTLYPRETRTLIEDVLRLGRVDDVDINQRFLTFFQDSTLQALIDDVDSLYNDLSDVDSRLRLAFDHLQQLLPDVNVPHVYTQVGSLDQSIIVSDSMLGISLDKYLGESHPVYLRYGYSEEQRRSMTRDFIVPDCIGFYLLSLYPQPEEATAEQRRQHMAKIQYVVNKVLGQPVFTGDDVVRVADSLKGRRTLDVEALLRTHF